MGDIFETTIGALEEGLRVRDIASFSLVTCEESEPARDVLRRVRPQGLDYVPVRGRRGVVGVLERGSRRRGTTAEERMRPLDDSMLVAAEQPLTKFLPLIADTPYRLVVRSTRIEGIVTQSDIQKLPVRLLVFAVVTHLERTMAGVIAASSDEEWIELLGDSRRRRVIDKLNELRARGLDPPLVELTEFADKRDILARLGRLQQGAARRNTIRDFRALEELRNTVAHAASFGTSRQQLREFVGRLQIARKWIDSLSRTTPTETS